MRTDRITGTKSGLEWFITLGRRPAVTDVAARMGENLENVFPCTFGLFFIPIFSIVCNIFVESIFRNLLFVSIRMSEYI